MKTDKRPSDVTVGLERQILPADLRMGTIVGFSADMLRKSGT